MTTPTTEPELRFELNTPVPDAAFVEVPGLRGIKVARIGSAGDKTLEVIAGVKNAVIPMRTCEGREQGRVLSGSLRFMREGEITELRPGDRWDIPGGEHQGPHVVLEPDTRVLVLREGEAALG
jgi:hypothetical protein